jgi:uncharacterized Zn-binding protein involved in type VI secretion
MIPVHRATDLRICGAVTVPTPDNRRTFVNGLLIALNGDGNSHGGGALIATATRTFVNGRLVARQGDPAAPDALCPVAPIHCAPSAVTGSPNVFVGT